MYFMQFLHNLLSESLRYDNTRSPLIKAGVAADLVRPRRKSGRTKPASGSGPDVAKSRGFSPGYVGLNFLL